MPKIILLLILCCCTALFASAQEKLTVKGDSLIKMDSLVKGDSLKRKKTDTVKYINYGKIAAKKALFRSLLIPGWGQVSNGLNVYRALKVAAIYGGGAALFISYKSNNKNYHYYLAEVQHREENNGLSLPGSLLTGFSETQLIAAKEVYRRNREVVMFSLIGVYAVNVLDAFIDARLKYFEVDNNLAMKISPSVISSNSMLGYNSSYAPALKVAFRL